VRTPILKCQAVGKSRAYILAKMNPTKCIRIVTNNWGQGINYLLC